MIAFTAPWALAGLVAAAVPILLHLLSRREPPTVEFPAVRYLSETARIHQRRLTLQPWLLLVLRTLLIITLVLAAAGPVWPRAGARGHAPAALVLVLDNSPSAGATVGGVPVLDRLRQAARAVLRQASGGDALWLVTADGAARRGPPELLLAMVDSLEVAWQRLDLGQAVGLGRRILEGEARPGEVMVLSDLQASAVTAAGGAGPLTVIRPEEPPPSNAGVARVELGPQPWTSRSGQVLVAVSAADSADVPLSASLGERAPRQALAAAGRPVGLGLAAGSPGWHEVRIELAPDELRADDRWTGVIRVAPPARVRWDPRDRYLAAASEVLAEGGRILAGADVTLGQLGAGPSIVAPPEDPAQVGALNRALAARGVAWRFGPRLSQATVTDSSDLLRRHPVRVRHRLEPRGGDGDEVLATAGGEPWVVRSGPVVLVGSRFDADWTALPLGADFLPFVDALVHRVAAGDLASVTGFPGEQVVLPDRVDRLLTAGGRVPVEGGAAWVPSSPGVSYLLRGRDTVGVLVVNLDPRESLLARLDDAAVRTIWPGSRVAPVEDAGRLAFAAAGLGDLRGPLLWLALVLGLTEAGLAGRRWRGQ